MQKPAIPKGTRDFMPIEMERRNYIFDTIKEVFRKYGFVQIETPAMENMSTLLGKYGDEGDRLLFRILNSGNFFDGVFSEEQDMVDMKELTLKIAEKGLRYDLTVPFARFVVQHKEQITFPFRRFQIQPVWRADRPQKGRYREFYQCDADVIGSTSLINEVELLEIIDEVFRRFGLRVRILLNNRKILAGIAEATGRGDRLIDITTAIDKLEKIGEEKVFDELRSKGFTEDELSKLRPFLALSGSNREKLTQLKGLLATSEEGQKGIEELEYILDHIDRLNLKAELVVDLSLARGLSYYTGAILEVKALDATMGSISGGGRYDNLTGIFGLPGLSGVGISFGADRIYDVLNQLELYPATTAASVDLLFINFGEAEAAHCLKLARATREAGIATEVFPDATKMKKQMNYANARQIPFVALVGESEMEQNLIALKNMTTGEQQQVSLEQLIQLIQAQ